MVWRRYPATPALAALALLLVTALACAPREQPTPTPTPTQAPSLPVASPTPSPTPTPTSPAAGQPRYGGTVNIVESDTGGDPLGWDPHATFTYRTHRALSFGYNTLLNFPVGPGVALPTSPPAPTWRWRRAGSGSRPSTWW